VCGPGGGLPANSSHAKEWQPLTLRVRSSRYAENDPASGVACSLYTARSQRVQGSPHISDDRRRDEKMTEQWRDAQPRVLGALLDLIVKGLRRLPTVTAGDGAERRSVAWPSYG
jgi:hypothetical protein